MSTGGRGSWVRRFHDKPRACRRLVCFPHAGGGASFWYPLSAVLPADVEVLVVQYPGREDRLAENLVADVSALADAAFAELRPWLDARTAFVGHSMGAVVAFEVARRCGDEGVSGPDVLIASACEAPSAVERGWSVADRDDRSLLTDLIVLGGAVSMLHAEEELLSMVMPAIRADLLAVERYESSLSDVVEVPVVALIGEEDPSVTAAQAHLWAAHTTGGFELRTLPGDHFFLVKDLDRFAAELIQILDEVDA